MIRKDAREERPHLLRMARKHGCLLKLVPNCLGDDTSTTVAAHANMSSYGKGGARRAHDWAIVYACHACHSELDQGRRFTRDEKKAAFEAALVRQRELYESIAADPLARPADIESAQWALERMAVRGP